MTSNYWWAALILVRTPGPLRERVTVKAFVTLLPLASEPMQTTFVTPSGNALPDGGRHTTVAPGALSRIATS